MATKASKPMLKSLLYETVEAEHRQKEFEDRCVRLYRRAVAACLKSDRIRKDPDEADRIVDRWWRWWSRTSEPRTFW